jgi:hypothetical protein
MVGIVENSAMARAVSSQMSPDELKKLAEAQMARAMRSDGPERLRVQTIAGAIMNLAEIKQRLLKYERRLLN